MTKEEFIQSTKIDGEEWKEYPEGDGSYVASTLGRIISTKRGEPHLLRLIKSCSKGKYYYYICPSLPSGRRRTQVHKIIALTFLGAPPSLDCEVDHINGNGLDNRVENLRWCTHAENMRNETSRAKWKKAVVRMLGGHIIKTYMGAIDAEADGFIRQNIGQVCRGVKKTHRGYQWMFLSDYEKRSD